MTESKNVKKKSIFRRLLKYLLLLLLFLIISVFTFLLLLPKFEFLQKELASKVEYFLEDIFVAQLKVGKINFKSYNNIQIEEVLLFTQGDTLAYIPKLKLEFKLRQLLSNNIHISKLKIYNSTFKLLRAKDSTWNYEHIVKETESDTSKSKTPLLNLNNIELVNCRFQYKDSLDTDVVPFPQINYSNFNVSRIYFKADAKIDIDKMSHIYNIKNLSFVEQNSKLKVKKLLSPRIIFTDKTTSVENLIIKANSSEMTINADADGFSPINFNYEDMFTMTSNFDVEVKKFETNLINYFADTVFKRNQICDVNIKGNGNLKSAIINDFSLENDDMSLIGSCIVKDYTEPDKLRYKANIQNSKADLIVLKNALNYDLSSVPEIKQAFVEKLEVDGSIYDYDANYKLKSSLGNFEGHSFLDIKKEKYNTNTKFDNFNLNVLIPNSYTSKLNGNVKLNGKNLDLKKLTGDISLNLTNSEFEGRALDSLTLVSNFSNGIVNLEKLDYHSANSKANITGGLDLTNLDNIKYQLNLNTEKLDLTVFNNNLPELLSSNITLQGVGIDPDKLLLNSKVAINDLMMKNKLIKDYYFDLIVDNSNSKNIYLNSDEININIEGNFLFQDITEIIENELEFINHNVEIVSNFLSHEDSTHQVEYLEKYPKTNAKINIDLISLGRFKEFLPMDLNFDTKFEINLHSDEDKLSLITNEIKINNFRIKENDTDLLIPEADIKLTYNKDINLDNPINNIKLFANSKKISYNKFNINDLKYSLGIVDDKIESNIDCNFLDSLRLSNQIHIKTFNNDNDNYEITIPKIEFEFGKYNTYFNSEPIDISIDSNIIETSNFSINSKNKEKIDLKLNFNMIENYINNFNLKFSSFDFANLKQFIPNEYLNTFQGDLDSFSLSLSKSLSNPSANISVDGKNITYSNIKIGEIEANFDYTNGNMKGQLLLGESKKQMSIISKLFPLNMNLESNELSFDENKDFDITIDLENLDAGLAEPFVPVVYNIKGNVQSKININGSINKGINYQGELLIDNGSFIVEPTNIMYEYSSKIDIFNDKFTLTDTQIKNKTQDLKGGTADISGYLKMNGFDFDYFEFEIKSKKFKVMREETKLVSPDLYGDMVIATGKNPLVFSGNFQYPKLKGDIDIFKSKLSMPNVISTQLVESKLKYNIVDNTIKIIVEDSSNYVKKEANDDFLDILALDINVRFLDDLELDIELNAITDMKIFLGTKYKEDLVIYQKDRKEIDAHLVGSIILRNDSYLTFLGKRFITTGEVTFPTGEIANPTLNIISKYSNFTPKGIPFEVLINVGGTKNQPILDFSYIYNNVKATEDKEEMKQNAFSLLALNMLKDEALGSGEQISNSNLQGEAVNIGNSILSNLATKNINEALLEYGVNANIDLDINNPNQSVVKLQGKVLNDIKWSVGGNISNFESNQVTIEVPLENLADFLGGFLQISKPNNPFIVKENQVEWEAKLRFGKTW